MTIVKSTFTIILHIVVVSQLFSEYIYIYIYIYKPEGPLTCAFLPNVTRISAHVHTRVHEICTRVNSQYSMGYCMIKNTYRFHYSLTNNEYEI